MRFTIDINFESEVEKTTFTQTLATVRELLTPRGRLNWTTEFLLALFDCARSQPRSCPNSARSPAEELSASNSAL